MRRTSLINCLIAVAAVFFVFDGEARADTPVSGGINTDTTWTLANSPYVLTNDVVVQNGATLTIEAGVEVRGTNAANGDVELIVSGAIIAQGTENTPIVFQADSGDAVGHWEGLRFTSGASALLRHLVIRHADYPLEFAAPNAENITVEDITIERYRTRGVLTNGGGTLDLARIDIDGTASSSGHAIFSDQTAITVEGGRLIGGQRGVYVTNAHATLTGLVIAEMTTDGFYAFANRTGTYNLTVAHCTFYNNTDGIDVGRSSSSSYNPRLFVSNSLFGENTLAVRDSSNSSYRIAFSTFTNCVWWGGSQFGGVINASTVSQTGTTRYNGLLADPENGDYEPTDRSPARRLDPADPDLTLGAVPHAGAETGEGVHGYWYVDRTFPAQSVTQVSGDMIIAPGVTVNFQPGAELRMAVSDFMDGGENSGKVEIRVEGTLEADGTISRPVSFTSAQEAPSRGDWYGIIIFSDTEAFNVAQVDIGFAMRGVSLINNDHIVAGSKIHDCSQAGIYIDGGTPSVEQIELFNNQIGIDIHNFANANIDQTDIYNSTTYGVQATHAGFNYERGQVYDNGNDGIRATISRTGTVNVVLKNLTIAHNAQDGVEIFRSSSSSYRINTTITDTTITHNNSAGVRDSSNSSYRTNPTCSHSNIWGNGSRIVNITSSTFTNNSNCNDYNPLYADIDARNYAPTTHSPNRKLGTNGAEIGALPFAGAPGPQLMGYLWEDFTFTADDSPYTILGDIVVPAGVTATFEAGAILRIKPGADEMLGGITSSRAEIRFLDGALGDFEEGEAPIRFAPDSDTPSPGNWYGLRFENGGTSTIKNALIEYAQYGVYIVGPSAPKIEDSEIVYSLTNGVQADDVITAPLVDVISTTIAGRGTGVGVFFNHSGGMVRSSFITHHTSGIQASLSKSRTVILHFINNTIVHQTRGIFYSRSSSSSYRMTVFAYNNVIANSTTRAIEDGSNSSYSVTDHIVSNNYFNTTSVRGAFNTNTNNTTDDPLVEDDDWETFPRWYDGKLWAEALAINTGNASAPNLPTKDLAGKTRNFAGGVDKGAFEFDPDANREPRADAVSTSIMVPRGEAFALDGSAALDPDGFIASAFWTMSDGTITPGLNIEHTFEVEGNDRFAYLTIIDDEGAEDHALVNVNVNIRPVADAGPSVFQDEGPDESVFFDGTLSQDPDGTVVAWSWDFGDGSAPSTEESPRHSYLSAGLYTVTLTVTDNEGLTHTDTTIATVFGNNDTVGPLVQHIEIEDGVAINTAVLVRATIQDPSDVASAVLFYRAIGAQGAQFALMSDLGNNLWEATIPANAVTVAGVQYWFSSQDNAQPDANTSTFPVGAPDGGVFDFLVVGDPDPPAIAHVEIEDNQPIGQAVTISATITDATGVGAANLYFRVLGGNSFGARSMSNVGGDVWTAQIPAFIVAAPGVEYYIDATDTSPVPNTGVAPEGAPDQTFDFTVGEGDNSAPLIAHTPIGDGQPEGLAITIIAGIVDNNDVTAATIHHRPAGSQGAFATAAMAFESGTTWRGQIPALAVAAPGVEYYISAEDEAENEGTNPEGAPGQTHTFVVSEIDSVGPVIEHIPAGNGQPEFQQVTISATITDPSGVDFAKIHYRPIGFPFYQEANMALVEGDWVGAIPGFSVTAPGVEYYIRAVDTAANTGFHPLTAPETPHTFTVGNDDDEGPALVHSAIEDGQAAGEDLVFEADVLDPAGVDSVTLFHRPTGGNGFTEAELSLVEGTTWRVTLAGEDVQVPGIEYYIVAVDSSPNNNATSTPSDAPEQVHDFTVVAPDLDAPLIAHTPRQAPLTFGDDLQIDATVSDSGSGVASVILRYAFDAEQFQARVMVEVIGDEWTATLAGVEIPDGTLAINYFFEARDNEGNEALLPVDEGEVFSVTLFYPDVTPPEVSIAPLVSPVEEGTPIEVSVIATDEGSGVGAVRVFYRRVGDESFQALAATGDGPYTATIPGDAVLVPGVEIFAEADDNEGNTGATETETVLVSPPPDVVPPSISLGLVPDGQPAGQSVTVVAQITDDSGQVGATLHYKSTANDGPFSAVSMSADGDTFTATIPGGDVQVPGIEYYVEATDGADNTAFAPEGGSGDPADFTVTPDDTSGPTITHAPLGGPMVSDTSLVINATIIDPSGVASASVFFRTAGTQSFTETVMNGAEDAFTATIGPLEAPGVEYYIEATDTLDNEGSDPVGAPGVLHEIEVLDPDRQAPLIDHTPIADGQDAGVSITITAAITDTRSGVTSARVFYRPIGGPAFGEAVMARANGDDWTAQIPGVIVNEPGVEYYIEATDGAEAPNTGAAPADAPDQTFVFTVGDGVIDQDAPTIAHNPIADDQPEGQGVEVIATITDTTGIGTAQVFFRRQGDEDFLSVPLSADGDTFTATIPSFAVSPPGVEYYIEATDSAPQANRAQHPEGAPEQRHAFTVPSVDVVAPAISLDPIDSPQPEGTPVAVVATVTDLSGVERVEVFFRSASTDDWESAEMELGDNDQFEAIIAGEVVVPDEFEIYIEAEDAVGNIGTEPEGGDTDPLVIDVEPEAEEDLIAPTILHSPPGGALSGSAITIQAIVTDASGVSAVQVNFREVGEEGFVSVALTTEGDDRWNGEIPSFATRGAAVEYFLEAVDLSPAANKGFDPESAPDALHFVEIVGDEMGDTGNDMDAGMDEDTGMGEDTGDDDDAGVEPDAVDDQDADDPEPTPPTGTQPDPGGCGCQTPADNGAPFGLLWAVFGLVFVAVLRRR